MRTRRGFAILGASTLHRRSSFAGCGPADVPCRRPRNPCRSHLPGASSESREMACSAARQPVPVRDETAAPRGGRPPPRCGPRRATNAMPSEVRAPFGVVLVPAEILTVAFEIFLPLRQLAILSLESACLAFGLFDGVIGGRFVRLQLSAFPVPDGAFRFEGGTQRQQFGRRFLDRGRLASLFGLARLEVGFPGGRSGLSFGDFRGLRLIWRRVSSSWAWRAAKVSSRPDDSATRPAADRSRFASVCSRSASCCSRRVRACFCSARPRSSSASERSRPASRSPRSSRARSRSSSPDSRTSSALIRPRSDSSREETSRARSPCDCSRVATAFSRSMSDRSRAACFWTRSASWASRSANSCLSETAAPSRLVSSRSRCWRTRCRSLSAVSRSSDDASRRSRSEMPLGQGGFPLVQEFRAPIETRFPLLDGCIPAAKRGLAGHNHRFSLIEG